MGIHRGVGSGPCSILTPQVRAAFEIEVRNQNGTSDLFPGARIAAALREALGFFNRPGRLNREDRKDRKDLKKQFSM